MSASRGPTAGAPMASAALWIPAFAGMTGVESEDSEVESKEGGGRER